MPPDLLRRIRGGDIAAFEELFRMFHGPLCEVVDSYVRSQAVAEEIVQDLFFVVWMRRSELQATSLRGYLFTAARNRALHHLKHRSVIRRWSLWIDSRPDVAGVAGPSPLPDQQAEAGERREALGRAVDALPARARLAVVLRWDHGMSNEEAAVAMGISIKGVEKLLSTAKTKLRQTLAIHSSDPISLPE